MRFWAFLEAVLHFTSLRGGGRTIVRSYQSVIGFWPPATRYPLPALFFLLPLSTFLFPLALAQPATAFLSGARHEYQRYNNCGPVTLGMALSYWGSRDTQYQIAPVLKPNKQDKNVNASEMAEYAKDKGYSVHYGWEGNLGLLKQLIAGGFPVIIETWFVTPDHGGMGHYRLLVGYNDSRGFFNAFDSYYGPKVTLRYGEVDGLWQVFGRKYLVIYPQNRQARLEAILDERMNPQRQDQLALEIAQRETQNQPNNAFAWFNLGTQQLRQGSAVAAARSFDRSRALPANRRYDPSRPANVVNNWPWRMMWYQFGPYEAYFKTGRYADVLTLANDVLRRVNDHEESYYWRGKVRQAQGNLAGARADFQAALRFKPNYPEAARALAEVRAQSSR
jgi:tetratricopeptide (TPR) repeat protein